jgi:peptidyl-prolyl cis-trans isomerase D
MRSGVAIADDEVRRTWLERNQSVSFSYVLVPSSDYVGDIEIDEASFRTWFEGRAADYDAGPGRLVRWVRFDRDAAQAKLEDETRMREYYEEQKDLLYTLGPDQRRASQVLVRLPAGASDEAKAEALAKAEAIAERARAGEDFAALAASESDDATTKDAGGDLGPFYAGTYDPAFDEAVFGAGEGEVVGPIESLSPSGYVIALVTKGEGEKVRAFSEVRDLVARGLYAAEAAKAVRSQLEEFQAALAANPDFAAAAAAAGLEASPEAWLTRGDGNMADGPGPAAVARAFNLSVGDTSDAVSAAGGQIVLQVLDQRDSSPRSFEEAREAAEADYRNEKAGAVALAEAEALAARAGSEGLETAAGDTALRTATELRKRAAVPGLGLEPELNAAALETPVDEIGPAVAVGNGAVVFQVTERKDFDAETFAQDAEGIRQELQQQRYQTLRQANLRQLRDKHGDAIVMNDRVLEPLRSTPQANPLG